MSGFLQVLKGFGAVRLAVMGLVGVGFVAFFLFLTLRMTAAPMVPLFSDLALDDATKIVTKLDGMHVPYVLRGDGSTILVPNDRVLKLRMALAEQGLPSGGTVGYELFDEKEALGTTNFVQQLNQLRALEGELARSIRTLDGVEAARVHLVLPRHELFSRQTEKPSASIVLKLRGGLSRGQVQAVQHLVGSAVPGLEPARVTVVDEHGTLLASGDDGDGVGGLATSLDQRTREIEHRLEQQIGQMVGSIVGPDKVRVQVAAQVDFNRMTRHSETFDPDGQVVRSTQNTEETGLATDGAPDGVSVGNNVPTEVQAQKQGSQDQADGGKSATPQSTSRNNRTEETTNYEISHTTRTEVREPGQIERLSVAVLVDGGYKAGPKGEQVYVPRSAEELKQIDALVRSAIGYDEKRGDQVRVANLRFAELQDFAPQAEDNILFGLPKPDLLRIVETLVLGVVALLIALLVVKPVLTRLLTAPVEEIGGRLALAGASAGAGELAMAGGEAGMALPGQPMAPPTALPAPRGLDSMIDIAQVEGQVKESSVRKVGEIVDRHPEEAIAIMRTWLAERR